MLALVAPRPDLVASYRGLVEEFRQQGEKPVPFTLEYPSGDADSLIARFERDRRGILESEEFSAERDEVVQRYWIDLRS